MINYFMKYCFNTPKVTHYFNLETNSKGSKQISENITNSRKNITLKHQLKFCCRLMSSKGFIDDIIVGADFSSYSDMMEPDMTTIPSKFLDGFLVNWVQIKGIKYYANSSSTAFFVGSANLLPLFGMIKKIIINSSN